MTYHQITRAKMNVPEGFNSKVMRQEDSPDISINMILGNEGKNPSPRLKKLGQEEDLPIDMRVWQMDEARFPCRS